MPASTDLAARVQATKTKIETLTRQRARSEAERDAAQVRLDQVASTLQDQFGVATPQEAQAKLAELNDALATAVDEVEAALRRTQ